MQKWSPELPAEGLSRPASFSRVRRNSVGGSGGGTFTIVSIVETRVKVRPLEIDLYDTPLQIVDVGARLEEHFGLLFCHWLGSEM